MSDSKAIELVGKVHGQLVYGRRKAVLVQRLSAMLPAASTLLDVGCGDGTIGKLVGQSVPGMTVEGAEFIPRADCAIPCLGFDGEHLPYADGSFDGCMFVDVLHHSRDALAIVRDAARVSRRFIMIKDHLAESSLDHTTLRFMDWVGNRPHGVELPYNYFSNRQWQELYRGAGLREVKVERKIPLYPFPFSAVFGRNLHFIALLEKI
ncbi:MAG: methyltransferase domain-containing protein [Terracidiphilus sp.]|jgi:SAM-dependent methyltransferase